MDSLDPEHERAADLERCHALLAAYEQLIDRSPQDDAVRMKLIEILEEVDELICLGRIPKRADRNLSRFNLPLLYSSTGSWERFLGWNRRQAEQESRPEVKARWLYGMAQLAQQQLGDPARAASFLREALELDPTFENARKRLQLLQ